MVANTESGWVSPLFDLIERRFKGKGLAEVLTGGWTNYDPPESVTKRPYGVVVPVAVRDMKFTNKTKYATIEFRVEVFSDTFGELDKILCPAVTWTLQHAPLSKPGDVMNVTMLRPGDIEYEKEAQIWGAAMTFAAQVNQPAAQTAPA